MLGATLNTLEDKARDTHLLDFDDTLRCAVTVTFT